MHDSESPFSVALGMILGMNASLIEIVSLSLRTSFSAVAIATLIGLPVNPARHPHVKRRYGQAFIDWLLAPKTQAQIASYRIHGEQAFFPNAAK